MGAAFRRRSFAMADIVIYTKPGCPFCAKAMALLDKKGVAYHNIIASENPVVRAEMVAKAHGRNTFPQIFIDGRHIGGCDDLFALEEAGKLDALLEKD